MIAGLLLCVVLLAGSVIVFIHFRKNGDVVDGSCTEVSLRRDCLDMLKEIDYILNSPYERKSNLPDGALLIVQKELELMIHDIDEKRYTFTPSYCRFLVDSWMGDDLADKLIKLNRQYNRLLKSRLGR